MKMASNTDISHVDTSNLTEIDDSAGDGISPSMTLQKIEVAVDNLYEYRDHYFATNGLEQAVNKAKDVKKKLDETLVLFTEMKDTVSNKAQIYMLRGKALNVTSAFNPEALDYLTKAVKFDPKLVEAWNHLGECYWKNGNIDSAKNCFTRALTYQKNKVSLRNLSMVLRQLTGSLGEKKQMVKDSVDKAKEATQLDVTDGLSWLILGNAYLNLFFAFGQNPPVLKQCMGAYKHASKDIVTQGNPDLHYNRAIAYRHQEEYQDTLIGFSKADMLDPGWNEPATDETDLLNFLRKVMDMIKTKGKMKPRKIESLIHSWNDEKDLGPYKGGSYMGTNGKTVNLQKTMFSDLQPESNIEKVVVGKVLSTLGMSSSLPFNFCMIDKNRTCISVNVYNMVQSTGVKIGDSVAIPDPYVQVVKVDHKGNVFNFSSIRVNFPIVMIVNGKKLGLDKQEMISLSATIVSD